MTPESLQSSPKPRHFLFLQGLMGPFFERIGQAFISAGYGVWKINFNGGDCLFWRLPHGISFTGRDEEWPYFLMQTIRRNRITDIMLFGDCRPRHREAIQICAELGVRIYVFEEGYIRPDWVTLEMDGVNGHSTLPRHSQWYVEQAGKMPPLGDHKTVPSSFRRRALEAVAYNAADILTRWHFPNWQDYRPWGAWHEGVSWLKRLSRKKKAQTVSQRILDDLMASGQPYMLFPLQLDADSQIHLHSHFGGMTPAILTVVRSFAYNAPSDLLLLIKEHPLDNGVKNWKKLIGQIADFWGVADRVRYVEYGDIALIVRQARGVVTINSTTGTLALAHNVPVKVLGRAIYNIDGVADQQDLDTFWKNPKAPESEILASFTKVLVNRCLIEGGFFSEEGLASLVEGTLRRVRNTEQNTGDNIVFLPSLLDN